jgi:hypothetical protein
LVRVIYMHLKMGGTRTFMEAVARVKGAVEATGYDIEYLWYELVDGGETPMMAIVIPADSWADLEPQNESFGSMLAEGLGEEAGAVMEALMGSIRSEYVETMTLMEKMSYFPEAN